MCYVLNINFTTSSDTILGGQERILSSDNPTNQNSPLIFLSEKITGTLSSCYLNRTIKD